MQLRVSDADYEFGYWILKDNFTVQFKPIDFTPKFRTYKHESEKVNDTDFWIKESIPDTPTEMKEVTFNINNKTEVIRAYFRATGNKSLKKFRFINNLIDQ
jgi:hypothetical protein